MAATRLPSVADSQREQFTLPMKIRPLQLTVSGMQLTEPGQAGEQVRSATQDFFQVFRRIGGDLTAKSTRRHVQENLPAHFAQIDIRRLDVEQIQRLRRLQRNTGGAGKIVGSAQR